MNTALSQISSSPADSSPPSERQSVLSFSRAELAAHLETSLGLKPYRADQIFKWFYQQLVFDPSLMTNIGKADRELLGALLDFGTFDFTDRQISKDGTRKYLFTVKNDMQVESVMIKQPSRMTLCVSSQVGCALGCKFCQTGTMGLTRHLGTEEILKQVMGVLLDAKNFDDSFSNIVFMGMGEPLHNFDNVTRAISILTDPHGLALSRRKITVSTVGLVPAIKRFFEENVQATLAVSLNGTSDDVRSEIMPINKKYPISVLLDTLRSVPLRNREHITLEYVMLRGVNDTPEDLERLPKLIRGIPCKVNLIPYNDNAGLGFSSPDPKVPHHWQKKLNEKGITATIRWSKGQDIDAACGQLVTQSTRKRK